LVAKYLLTDDRATSYAYGPRRRSLGCYSELFLTDDVSHFILLPEVRDYVRLCLFLFFGLA
jgi:hypothetical protein